MMPVLDHTLEQYARPVNWRGRSGRYYALAPVDFTTFAFSGNELYLVALGSHVLWAGSANDIVEDSVSRARFRLAMECGDRVFHVESETDAVERMTILWDLEGAEPVTGLSAA